MKNFLLFIFCMLIVISNAAKADEINVTSNPEDSVVYTVNTKTGKKVKLGKTPYKGSLETLIANASQSNVFMLEIAKPGFEPYRLMVTKMGSADINLNANLEVSKNISLTKDMDLLAGELFDVQRMIRSKDFQSSLKKLELLEKKFPHFSIIYEMKGSVYYLTKEFKRALNFYRKAFAMNPENMDAYRMKVYLEKKFNLNNDLNNQG